VAALRVWHSRWLRLHRFCGSFVAAHSRHRHHAAFSSAAARKTKKQRTAATTACAAWHCCSRRRSRLFGRRRLRAAAQAWRGNRGVTSLAASQAAASPSGGAAWREGSVRRWGSRLAGCMRGVCALPSNGARLWRHTGRQWHRLSGASGGSSVASFFAVLKRAAIAAAARCSAIRAVDGAAWRRGNSGAARGGVNAACWRHAWLR